MKKLIIACALAACVLCGCQAVEEPTTYYGLTEEEYEQVYGESIMPGQLSDQAWDRWQELKGQGLTDEQCYQVVVMGIDI